MGFVNDYLTEDEKKRFEKYQIKNAPKCTNNHKILGTEKNLGGVWCTVDRARNIYLFDCGGNSRDRLDGLDYSEYFALVVINDIPCVSYFALKQHYRNIETDGCDYYWELSSIDNKCKNYSDNQMLDYLRQALNVFGLDGEPYSEPSISKFSF